MGKLARRFTIFTLTMTVFALVMSALVEKPEQRVHRGTSIPCFHPNSIFCVAQS
ncbi:hypothetical protein ACQQ2Q_01725 [Agrobacterium sp. ES01]|uniref:hypothetical protein n=1 Tax=Agrobacterium sp. ES01 TaxID=3420714 RepID=UPI003D0F840C